MDPRGAAHAARRVQPVEQAVELVRRPRRDGYLQLRCQVEERPGVGEGRSAPGGQRTGVSGPGSSVQTGQRGRIIGHPCVGRRLVADEVLQDQDAVGWICRQQGRHHIGAYPAGQSQGSRLPGVPVAGIGAAGNLLDDRRGAAELNQPDS